MSLLHRKRTILAKIESSYGTDPTPTGGSNAMLISNLTVTPMETTLVGRDTVRPYLGNSEQIAASIYARVAFEVELVGSGTAATAASYDPLLRACGLAATATTPAVTGTATAGAASSITLAAGASDDMYNGMPIVTTGGTGSGQTRIITDYVTSTKVATVDAAWTVTPDATTTYSISANQIYRPISSSFESVTIYFNVDGLLHKLTGARGNVSLKFPLFGIPKYAFTFTGIYSTPTDTAAPTVTLTGFKTPLAVNNTNTAYLVVHGLATAVAADISIDLANSVTYRSLVGGSQQVLITDRKPAGSVSIETTLVATKDWWTAAANATLSTFSLIHGTSAGYKVAVHIPQLQITKPNYAEKDGVSMLNLGLVAVPSATGNDEISICTH